MDRVVDVNAIVRHEVADYNDVHDYKVKGYFLEDAKQSVYSIVIVPEADHPFVHEPSMMMLARVVGDKVVIDEDKTDRPLFEALVEAGIPREKIVIAYAGEKLAAEDSQP
jgi:XisI protein